MNLKAEGGGGRNSELAQQQEERRRAVEEQKEGILAQILTQDARERCTFMPVLQLWIFDPLHHCVDPRDGALTRKSKFV